MAAKNSKSLYKTAAVLFVLGVGYLMFSGISESSIPFVTVAEAVVLPSDKLQSARIFGTVKSESIAMLEGGSGVKFLLEDSANNTKTMWVVFKGTVPDTFKAGAEIYVEGKQEGGSLPFSASTLITKCPSKYQKENRTS